MSKLLTLRMADRRPPLFLLAAWLLAALFSPASCAQRVATSALAPLIFSLKQTGVPAGGMLAGAILPSVALAFGWHALFSLVFVPTGGEVRAALLFGSVAALVALISQAQ